MLPSLLETLQRHGLIIQDDNTAKDMVKLSEATEQQAARRQRPNGGRLQGAPVSLSSAGMHNVAPPPSWSATNLGDQVLERYREAGADLPDG